MTMPASGVLNMGGTSSPVSVAQELGLSLTATISMNDANVRTLAGVGGSGTSWSMNSLYGKSNRVSISSTFAASTANASLNVAGIGGYIAGRSDITVTVNSSVYLYSTSTGTPGLTLTGGTAGDTLTVVNNGFIMGMGGVGGNSNFIAAGAGGTALSLGYTTTVNNTNGAAYIGGGGGGGGGGNANGGGGGAGGGVGGSGTYVAGGTGGGIGATGSNGAAGTSPGLSAGGGGGGRIFPGVGGASVSSVNNQAVAGNGGGSGGSGSAQSPVKGSATSGAGGSGSAVGGNGGPTVRTASGAGGGGGWGATGGTSENRNSTNVAGGAGGKAVALNGFSITWTSGDTTRVYGSVS